MDNPPMRKPWRVIYSLLPFIRTTASGKYSVVWLHHFLTTVEK